MFKRAGKLLRLKNDDDENRIRNNYGVFGYFVATLAGRGSRGSRDPKSNSRKTNTTIRVLIYVFYIFILDARDNNNIIMRIPLLFFFNSRTPRVFFSESRLYIGLFVVHDNIVYEYLTYAVMRLGKKSEQNEIRIR